MNQSPWSVLSQLTCRGSLSGSVIPCSSWAAVRVNPSPAATAGNWALAKPLGPWLMARLRLLMGTLSAKESQLERKSFHSCSMLLASVAPSSLLAALMLLVRSKISLSGWG